MIINQSKYQNQFIVTVFIVFFTYSLSVVDAKDLKISAPHAKNNPQSPLMLDGNWVPDDSHKIDFDKLPVVPSQLSVVSDVRSTNGVNQHNYLIHHAGQFWIMWSDGPGIEDQVGQRVKYATSLDGTKWSKPEFLTSEPPNSGQNSPFYGTRTVKGFRWIARGFWLRDNKLIALASLDEAAGFFGRSLALYAFSFDPASKSWKKKEVVHNNTINNFPPKKIPNGQWMMSRRQHDYKKKGVHFLVGGVSAIDQWKSFPVLGSNSELTAEEPFWWVLPDNNLMALFRDNRHSGYLFRSFSTNNGSTWSKPVKTNFPDATSKIHGLRLRDGRYVLISNPNPKKRDPLTISISNDGMVFHKMGYLVGGRWIDYPHVIEHGDHLLIAFSGNKKQSIEVLKIRTEDLNTLQN